jgi:hypothetical protein
LSVFHPFGAKCGTKKKKRKKKARIARKTKAVARN